jgi:predicted  nucleic acid-binding Zn-ribbon protein
LERLRAELAEVEAERDDYRDTVDALLKDCDRYLKRIKQLEGKFTPEARDRILAALGVGKQSPQYKRVKAALDQIIGSP